MANKVGQWKTKPPWPFPKEDSNFPELSAIVGQSGKVIRQLDNQEGIIVEEISINPGLKTKHLPPLHGKWTHKPPALFKLFFISETLGHLKYFLSIKRRWLAKKVSTPNNN